jgi:glycosyltransferase involved in cell wall biosynthesis
MKIVLGTESYWPNISGVATVVENLANFATKHGHEIFIITPDQGIKTYPSHNPRLKILPVGAIKNPFRKNTRFTFNAADKIKSDLDKIKPDVIHLHDPAGVGSALIRYGKENKIPLIMTNHFSIDFISVYLRFLGPLRKLFERILIKRFTRLYNSCEVITTPSQINKKLLKSWGVKGAIRVFYNGIETNRFIPSDKALARRKLGLAEKPTIIYAGRVDKDKSVPVLLQAIPKVLDNFDVNFIFVGGGQDLERIKEMASDLNILKSVKFFGFLANDSDEYPLTFQASEIFFSASTVENQSIVMLEALSTGLPIVAARAGSFPEFIKEGANGLLFKPADSEELAQDLIKLLSDRKMLERMGRMARESALPFDLSRTLQRFLDLYEELIIKNAS